MEALDAPLDTTVRDDELVDLVVRDAGRKTRWLPSLHRKTPDFCALFAADGLRQLETYLANWAAYDDYLAGHSRASTGGGARPMNDDSDRRHGQPEADQRPAPNA